MLRRLLGGDYARAWRMLGFYAEPWVSATSLPALLGTIDRSLIHVAFAPLTWTVSQAMTTGKVDLVVMGPIVERSMTFIVAGYDRGLAPVYVVFPPGRLNKAAAHPTADAQAVLERDLGRRVERGLSLTEYLRSPAAIVQGTEITRRDVLAYVANKLGGAHYDTGRERRGDERYRLLDNQLAIYTPEGKPPTSFPFVELLAIAETIAESSDAARFRHEYAKMQRTALKP